MSPVDEIKSRITIEGLIREYIEIKKAGANYKAICPFHSEKSPSFMVSPDKQIWHCFGCAEGGDIFGFIMRIEGVDFPEAIKLLAKKAGVTLTQQDPKIASLKTKLMDILEESAKYFALELKKNKIATEYIKSRAISEETASKFQLGFSPNDWSGLINYLSAIGFRGEDIVLAGLALKRDGDNTFYNRFRGRIMFPITNHYGNIVGFTARVLPQFDDGKIGKYVNTPETITYKKSQILYGLNFAKQDIRKEDCAIFVEGNMDVIALHQAGFNNIVATSGTALTIEQATLVSRYTNNVIMSFDADDAGIQAALRGIDVALSKGLNVKVIEMPKNDLGEPIAKDPDELIKKDPKLWGKAVKDSKHIIDFLISINLPKFKLSEPTENATFCKIIVNQINKIKNSLERSLWIKKLSQITGVPENIISENTVFKNEKTAINKPELTVKNIEAEVVELRFLSLLINLPEKIKENINDIPAEALKIEQLREFYIHLILYYNNNESFIINKFKEWLDSLSYNTLNLDKILLYYDKEYSDKEPTLLSGELEKIAQNLKDKYLTKKKKLIMQQMKEAEKTGDREMINQILQKFNELK